MSTHAKLLAFSGTLMMALLVPTLGQSESHTWMRDFVESRVLTKTLRSIVPTSSEVPKSEMQRLLEPKIVGGQNAGPNENPFQVALLDANINNNFAAQFCGGTLVRQNFVVTAAHCSDFIRDVNDVEVLTGTRRLDGTGQRRAVARIAIHWSWDPQTFDHDVAVWELGTNATNIPLATLATEDGQVGNDLMATGWGTTTEGGTSPIQLQRVQVPLISRTNCNDANSYNGDITANMICAGLDQGGRDSCQGDSGGPLTRGNGNTVLTGITSWGFGCARPNLYGVYTRVSRRSIREFIESAIHFERLGTAAAGSITEISLASLGDSRVVAAMRDGSNNLRLISWDIASNGDISRRGTATAGAISEVAISPLSTTRVVTAMRDGGNNLRLITWDVGADDSITRRGTATAGAISKVVSAPLNSSRLVASMRDGSNNLRLISWDVTFP